jgi:hypothetical protein
MGAQHSFNVATGAKLDSYAPVIFMFTVIVMLFAVAEAIEAYHNYMYPYGLVFVCDDVDGVVLELQNGRKSTGPYYLDGVEVDEAVYRSCEPVEPPFNE